MHGLEARAFNMLSKTINIGSSFFKLQQIKQDTF